MNNQEIFVLYREAGKRTKHIKDSCKKLEDKIIENNYKSKSEKDMDIGILLCMEEFLGT